MSAAAAHTPEIKNMWGKFIPNQEFKTLILPSGVEVGVAKGLLATWGIDEGNDQFVKGAFADSIKEHRSRNMRQLRISNEHAGLIGGAPIESVRETSEGLEIEAHINLEHTDGKNVWALTRQEVIVDFSIGFTAIDWEFKDEIRLISKATIWHGSTVSEPMNRAAQIQAVKSFQAKLPIAPEDYEWNRGEAWKRLRASNHDLTVALIGHNPVCDIVGGAVTVIPQALDELVKGGVHDTDEIRLVERYYAAMKKASPFDRSERQFFTREDVEKITAKELESFLVSTDRLSKRAAKFLVSRVEGLDTGAHVHNPNRTNGLAEIRKELRAALEA